jgi:aryl-alcohol dehydrogenase-like predicted oxidoreductase
MEYRKLGGSDLEVSIIGFGAWGIGGEPFWKSEGHTASENAIKKAYDLGINFFDTAPVYGFGRSEEIMGKALKMWSGMGEGKIREYAKSCDS